ncbi:MAG: universal stress protein [Bacteroidetes bacterium]|nr:universal stress protein [Bacteroidota bacterium]
MRNIIIPVDSTGAGMNAAKFGVDIALERGMDVYLLDVLELNGGKGYTVLSQSVLEELLNHSQEQLKELSEKLGAHAGQRVLIRTDLETGKLEERLMKLCGEKHPFLVVAAMGRLFKGLQFPLLLIPEGVSFRGFRHVVVACDREDIHTCLGKARPLIRQLTDVFHPRFTPVHVLTEGEGSAGKIILEYQSWAGSLEGWAPTITLVRQPAVGEGMAEYLGGHDADLLLVFPKKHSWLESHVSKAAEITGCSSVPVMLCGPSVQGSGRDIP